MKRLSLALAAVAGLVWLACSEGPTTPSGEPSVLTLPDLIVSDVLPVSTSGGPSAVASEAEMAFVSLPPGALPQMVSVRIRNADTGESTPSIPLVEGGFDPVPVAATAGHRLELSFTDGKGAVSVAHATVPDRRAPVVVRTNPPRGRTDVALSIRPWVVFSEPIDPETLAAGVRLLTGGTEVAVSVAWLAGQPWTAELVPATALEPGTTYELLITTDIRDLDGGALAEPVTVTFTTASALSLLSGQIAFVSDRDGGRHIYVAEADGSNVRRLTEGSQPAWSADGRKLAFVRGGSVEGGIYVMGHASGPTYVGEGVSPTWSPDGRIAFLRFGGWLTADLYVMNADGSGVIPLLEWGSKDAPLHGTGMGASWSPDGQRIAVRQCFGCNTLIVDANGYNRREIMALGDRGGAPAWSPDGSRLAAIGDPGSAIYSVDVSSDLALADVVYTGPPFPVISHLDWSPDGSRILFTGRSWEGDGSGPMRIFTVSLETGQVRQLIPDAIDPVVADYSDWGAVWSRANR